MYISYYFHTKGRYRLYTVHNGGGIFFLCVEILFSVWCLVMWWGNSGKASKTELKKSSGADFAYCKGKGENCAFSDYSVLSDLHLGKRQCSRSPGSSRNVSFHPRGILFFAKRKLIYFKNCKRNNSVYFSGFWTQKEWRKRIYHGVKRTFAVSLSRT